MGGFDGPQGWLAALQASRERKTITMPEMTLTRLIEALADMERQYETYGDAALNLWGEAEIKVIRDARDQLEFVHAWPGSWRKGLLKLLIDWFRWRYQLRRWW
jgi:hypothetical protein